jgi:hypothetical protein
MSAPQQRPEERPCSTLPTNSPPNLPQNAAPEFAVARARLLVGCYRREDFSDPEIAFRAFVSVLARYPEDIVIKVTEPATGIPSKLKWPPSIAEVVDACNEAMAPILREFDRKMTAYRQARLLAPPPPGPKMTVAEMEAKLGRPLSKWAKQFPNVWNEKAEREREAWRSRREEVRRESDGLPEPPEAA